MAIQFPVLQLRWKLEGTTLTYYGLRKMPHTFHWTVRVSAATAAMLGRLDGKTPLSAFKGRLNRLISKGIVVDASQQRKLPASLEDAHWCVRCAANDYIIPGLELDEAGLCPLCATREKLKSCRSILPNPKKIPKSKKSRYDVAVFYTGGKDSSYLLYRLAKQKLRVLALTWEIPYLSDNARQSIENAKMALPNVDFIVKPAPPEELSKIYQKLYELQENTCICPSVAYVLFYPLLVKENVPYLVLGNEPAQVKNLLYNGMAPRISYRPGLSLAALGGFNAGRLLTLKKPVHNGQFQMLATIRQLLYGCGALQRAVGYRNELLENVGAALQESPKLLAPLEAAYQKSRKSGEIPRLIHFDFHELEGCYQWNQIKEQLRRELGWQDTPACAKGLHTSCKIERCKEYSQFRRFRAMESRVIPFSAMELALAVGDGSISREEAAKEIAGQSGFRLEEPEETALMKAAFEAKEEIGANVHHVQTD